MVRQNSFFGGPAGDSFSITHRFRNKREMEADIDLKWSSSIHPGDYICISYGLPSDTETYTINRDIDLAAYGETYNGTFWQKIYSDSAQVSINSQLEIVDYYGSELFGIGYKLVTSLSGATPVISFSSERIGATENPYIVTDTSSADNPSIKFYLPEADTLAMNVIGSETFDNLIIEEPTEESLNDIGVFLTSLGYDPDRDELVAVNLITEKNITFSFWFYKVKGEWKNSFIGSDTGTIFWRTF